MKMSAIASRALPGLLLGMCFAATAAEPQQFRSAVPAHAGIDAKTGRLLRPLTASERRSLADSVASRQRNMKQPRTETEARATLVRDPKGSGMAMQVPTSLWSTLSAQKDAQGNVRVHESEGTQAPVVTQEGLPNE